MDAARLENKVFAGYEKAARRVAPLCSRYRPVGLGPAIVPANLLGQLNCAFTVHSSSNFSYERPSGPDHQLYHALCDARLLDVGDYIVDPAGLPRLVLLVIPAMPPLVIECNHTVSVFAPGPANVDFGKTGYGGTVGQTPASDQRDNEPLLLDRWPASLIARRVMRERYLPTDAGQPMFRCILPAPAGLMIQQGSIIVDDLTRRYSVSTAERQPSGWRLDVQLAAA